MKGYSYENTKNALLTEKIRKMGTDASFEKHYRIKTGIQKPDITIANGAYLLEAKQKPCKLVDAVGQAVRYKEVLGVYKELKGVFAVLYPKEDDGRCEIAVLLNRAPFYMQKSFESMDTLAKWIHNFVLSPVIPQQINTQDAIKLLNETVTDLSEKLSRVGLDEIDKIFGGKAFFETVLGYEEEKKVPIKHLRTAAAYLLINQLLFYKILSKETNKYPALESDNIQNLQQLREDYFLKVLEDDYKPIFDFDISFTITDKRAIDSIKLAIDAIDALSPEKHEHDILGKIFHNLIPLDIRKVVAAYFTNSEAAEILADLSIDNENSRVIDLACGSGTLLVAAYRRKKELILRKRNFTENDHKKFVEDQLTGMDIMPFAAHLAAVHLALQAPSLKPTDKVRIAIHNSTILKPEDVIREAHQTLKEGFKDRRITDYFGKKSVYEKIVAGVVGLSKKNENEELKLGYADVAILNPPFTRQERLPQKYKISLDQHFVEYSKYLHGQMGLHGYFIFLADKFLEKGGRLAFVLPATILRLKSNEGIRRFLLENYHIEHIITTVHRAAFSENAQFREMLLIAKKVKEIRETGNIPDNSETNIISFHKLPQNLEEAKKYSSLIRGLVSGRRMGAKDIAFRKINRNVLEKNIDNLFRLIATSDIKLPELRDKIKERGKDKISTLGNFLATVNGTMIRGLEIKSGSAVSVPTTFIMHSKDRMLKSGDSWYVEKESERNITVKHKILGTTLNVPKNKNLMGLRRISGIRKMDITNELDYIVVDNFFKDNHFFLDKYGNVKKEISSWKTDVENRQANIVINRRFDISAPGTSCISFYSEELMTPTKLLFAIKNVEKSDAKIINLWLNSSMNLLQVLLERAETRGAFLELSGYILDNILILNPSKLLEKNKRNLIKLFEQVKDTEFTSLLKQLENNHTVRKKIDKGILSVLGFSEKEIEDLLKYLYKALYQEIRILKSLMGGK